MATNTQVGGYAAISQYLFQVDTLKKSAFNGGGLDNIHAKALLMVRKAFDWAVINDTTSANTLNPYLYSLCGSKLQQAIAIYNGGGGSIIPSPIPGGGGILLYPLDIPITGSGYSGLKYYSSPDIRGLQGLTTLSIINTVFQKDVSFTFNPYDGLNGTINFDLSSTTGNVYTLQDGDIITANGAYKIINS